MFGESSINSVGGVDVTMLPDRWGTITHNPLFFFEKTGIISLNFFIALFMCIIQ